MSKFDSDGSAENEWEDRGDLAWNEFDWERYLREQDEAVHRYLGFYEACKNSPDRIDDVAELMDWDCAESETDDPPENRGANDGAAGEDAADFSAPEDIYTLHKNPIFVSTKALCLSLRRQWELIAVDGHKVPQPLAVRLLVALAHTEEQAVQAVHALDFGDYTMAVSLFKRALSALNATLALLNDPAIPSHRAVLAYREEALPRLFDLREIWLRVVAECREESERPIDDES
jgi:hypothetical protein